jgi:predicted flap endonuclease-1-like 5' DNA nuclease
MSHAVITAVIAILVIVGALVLVMRVGGGKAPAKSPLPAAEQHDVASAAAAAVEDVAGPFIGVDAHPDHSGPPDELTRIKGLGPKAAAQLQALGITRYAQLGELDSAQAKSIDQQMGVFRGRLERDRWIEQARYLARGDTATFEKEFGKLG